MRKQINRVTAVARAGEFFAYEPLDYASEEQRGFSGWPGPRLAYIPVNENLGHISPFVPKLKRLILSAWKHAQPTEGQRRSYSRVDGRYFEMGGHRGTSVQQPLTFRSAAPIAFDPLSKKLAPHLESVVPNDWRVTASIPFVSAYTFRGDRRAPDEIQAAGGFKPPISRTDRWYVENVIYPTFARYLKTKLDVDISRDDFDRILNHEMPLPDDRLALAYYGMWRSQVERESMHLGRMLAKEDLKGYVSTTKAVSVAKAFAREGGYVYVTRVRCGFHIPSKGQHDWTPLFGEEEIAVPTPISWNDIVGYREVGTDEMFTGPCCFRMGWLKQTGVMDAGAGADCYHLLSGAKQPLD